VDTLFPFQETAAIISRNCLVSDAISSSFVIRIATNFASLPRNLIQMSNSASTQSAARVVLAGLPTVINRVTGAALPHPLHDPFPDMTLALYAFWHAMIPFVGFSATGAATFFCPASQPNMSIGQAFTLFGPFLVSHSTARGFIFL
jgi:hypothetical protein